MLMIQQSIPLPLIQMINSLQTAADKFLEWRQSNGMLLNANKTKEMVIYFEN
jgi:hypothetical protein